MKIRLKAPKPLPYEAEPKTLGGHLKKRRHELGLQQKQVAERLKINQWTYIKWEANRVDPEIRYWPRIIEFLGYDPNPFPETLGERLRATYRTLGLPRKRVAARLQIDEGTLIRYERGEWTPKGARWERIKKFLESVAVRLKHSLSF